MCNHQESCYCQSTSRLKYDVAHRQVPPTAAGSAYFSGDSIKPHSGKASQHSCLMTELGAVKLHSDYASLQRQKAHEVSNSLAEWRTSSQHFIIALRAARLQEAGACQATSSFAPRRARKLPSPVARTGGQKSHKTPSRGRGWPLKLPPVPRGSCFTHGMPHAKGLVCFCRRAAYFQKQLFFSEPYRTCLRVLVT